MIPEHQIDRDGSEEFVIDLGDLQIDKIATVAARHVLRVLHFLTRIFDF